MATRRTPFGSDTAPADPPPDPSGQVEGAAPASTEPEQMPTLDTPEKVVAYLRANPSSLQMMSKEEIIAMFAGSVQAEELAAKKAAQEQSQTQSS